MKPKYPLTPPFCELPNRLPLFRWSNALLPGGELPLELSEPEELALVQAALKQMQMIGIVQPGQQVGCAGRLRQYRERKDGRVNIMLTGVCRFAIKAITSHDHGYQLTTPDWHGYDIDYLDADIDSVSENAFKHQLRDYFDRRNMQTDWQVLNDNPIEQVVNNLVLVMDLDSNSKQRLLEARTVNDRLRLFTKLLHSKVAPILARQPDESRIN